MSDTTPKDSTNITIGLVKLIAGVAFFPDKVKIASPEEARELGLVNPRYADALDEVARKHDNSEFESTAIARPEQFFDVRELGDPEEA